MLKEERNVSKFNIIGYSVISLICIGLGLGIIIKWINESLIFVIMGFCILAGGLLATNQIFVKPKYKQKSDISVKTPNPQTMVKSRQDRPLVNYNVDPDSDYSTTELFRLQQRY